MVTSIINQKGGTGKTTTAVNLGSALSKKNNVLLVDMDPQGNLSYSLGINDFKYCVVDFLTGNQEPGEICEEREGMHVMPTDQRLSQLELDRINALTEFSLKKSLEKVTSYDHVLIDCPPSLSMLTLNALAASDYVVIPIQLDVFSIQGLEQILATIDDVRKRLNKKLNILGVLPVLVDGRKKLTMEVKDYVKENLM